MGFWGIPVTVAATPTNPQDTDRSTIDTLKAMRRIAREASTRPTVISTVGQCLSLVVNPAIKREIARAIYWCVKQRVRFVEDEDILSSRLGYVDVQQELLIAPDVVLSMPNPMGDCDDHAMLIAAMGIAANIAVKFVAIACDEMEPFRFSHVYAMYYLCDEGRWVGMDTSHGTGVGWEYKGPIYRRVEMVV
jgi:transglutaminase-like putative cysteine protease